MTARCVITMTLLCITSSGHDLDSLHDQRFGRCSYFIIIDSESMEFEAIQNDAIYASGGAGIQAAQTIASKNVEVLITGSVGPNAYSALASSGIKMYSASVNTVLDALELFKEGKLTKISTAGHSHKGMGGGGGNGRGNGGGR